MRMGSLLVQSDCSSLRLVDETLHHQTHVRTVGQTLRPPFLSLVFNIKDRGAKGDAVRSLFRCEVVQGFVHQPSRELLFFFRISAALNHDYIIRLRAVFCAR